MGARIADSAYRAQQAIERGDSVIVGVNRFIEPDAGAKMDLQQIDAAIEREQVARLAGLPPRARSRRASSARSPPSARPPKGRRI